jgi:hypothetical protein
MRNTFVILMVFNEVGHPAGLFDKHWRARGEYFLHMMSLEEHPLYDEYLIILVLVDNNMILEARYTHVQAFNLPIPSEEDTREGEEIDRRARRRILLLVIILQLSGDLGHSRACVEKSINGDYDGNFKFNNGQRSVFDTLTEAKDDEARHSRAFFISSVGGTGRTYLLNTLLNTVRSTRRRRL